MLKFLNLIIIFCAFTITVFNQTTDPYQPIPYVKIQHPEWARKAVMYQTFKFDTFKLGTQRDDDFSSQQRSRQGFQLCPQKREGQNFRGDEFFQSAENRNIQRNALSRRLHGIFYGRKNENERKNKTNFEALELSRFCKIAQSR